MWFRSTTLKAKEDLGIKSHKVLGIAPVAIIDRQLPFEYTVTSRSTDVMPMTLPVQNINHSAFRSMFKREKLSGNNFNDWFRQLKLVLRVQKKMYVIEQPIPPAPAADFATNMLAEWNAVYHAYNEVAHLMLRTEMERFDLISTFHDCKQEEGKPVAAYVLKKKGYVEQLEHLGYVFVRNYNMHNMRKTIDELHAMLIEYEKGLPKKGETPQVMVIRGGKIQKANKKSLKAKGKGNANGKGKDKQVYIPKPKNHKPSAKEHPAKDDTCHHCKEVGHWKRNCPVYLAELLKKKTQVSTASSSGIFTIEFFSFPNKSWVYDTGCGTQICITKQGLRGARKLEQGALYFCFTDYGVSVSKNDILYFNAIPRDDYSHYGYVYLLNHKHEVFETFKVFKNEVENQLGKTIKALRSDRGGKYISQEFKDYLKACGIVQQLTPLYTSQHNDVFERRNHTLLDMVRSMMNITTLSLSFRDYALEFVTRILNMVPTKKVDKTPYELWYGKVPNLSVEN
ncbi:retrotransposon protein, putative, ty1-copia subclass [Tanacetum coccineum]